MIRMRFGHLGLVEDDELLQIPVFGQDFDYNMIQEIYSICCLIRPAFSLKWIADVQETWY